MQAQRESDTLKVQLEAKNKELQQWLNLTRVQLKLKFLVILLLKYWKVEIAQLSMDQEQSELTITNLTSDNTELKKRVIGLQNKDVTARDVLKRMKIHYADQEVL